MTSRLSGFRELSRENLVQMFKETVESLVPFFDKKSEDYDIQFYKEVGGFYLLLRIREKYHRLHNLLQKESKPEFESIEDTIKDLSTIFPALYSMIQFDLMSIDQVKELYKKALEVDIDDHIRKIDEKKRRAERKWYQFWKR